MLAIFLSMRITTSLQNKLLVAATACCFALSVASCTKGKRIDEPGNLVPKTADQDASVPSAKIGDAILHTEAFGNPDSPMLLVLHGGPGSDYRYLLNCKAFANDGYYVVFYDQRGSGLSQRFSRSSYTIDQVIEEVGDVIKHYRTAAKQKVFILGHSWGGMLASAYINKYPQAIDGAILGEPGGLTYDQMRDYLSRSRPSNVTKEITNDAVYIDQILTGTKNGHEILDYKMMLMATADASEESAIGNEGTVPEWRTGAVISYALFDLGKKQGFNWTPNLSQFNHKILFLYSSNNKAYGEAHAKAVAAPYRNVQLYRVDGAGHDMLSFPTGWKNAYGAMLQYLNESK